MVTRLHEQTKRYNSSLESPPAIDREFLDDASQLLLGNTLGVHHRAWRHVKGNGLPDRNPPHSFEQLMKTVATGK